MQLRKKMEYFLATLGGFRSPETVRWYKGKLQFFAEFVEERWGVTKVEDLGQEHLIRFFQHLRQERSCAEETIRGYWIALRAFFQWIEAIPEFEGITSKLLPGLPKLHRPKRVTECLTEEEVNALVSVISDERDRAIIAAFLGTGVRSGELAALQVEDVDFSTDRIVIRQPGYGRQVGPKGGDERLVPLTPVLKSVLADYLGRIRPRSSGNGSSWLFLTRRGKQFSTEGLYRLVQRWLIRAGIRKRQMGPHLLRRTYASSLRANGLSKSDIAVRLGHASSTGTMVVDESYISREAEQMALGHGPDPLGPAASVFLGRLRR